MTITRYHFNSFALGCHFAQGNEFQSMQPTIIEMVKASDYDTLAARVAALELALDPRRWDMPLMRAWHANIPDTEAAFKALREAALAAADGATAEGSQE